MSPTSSQKDHSAGSFPRVSGDEPDSERDEARRGQFSPRERG